MINRWPLHLLNKSIADGKYSRRVFAVFALAQPTSAPLAQR